MGKNFEFGSDIRQDTANAVGNDTKPDYGGDLAKDDGVDLNKTDDAYSYGYEADSTEGSANNPFPVDTECEPNEFTSGFSGEEYNLGNQLESPDENCEKTRVSKTAELPPPSPQYDGSP